MINYENGIYAPLQSLDLSHLPAFRKSDDKTDHDQNIQELGHFYKGLAFMQTGNVAQALHDLQWIIDKAKKNQLSATNNHLVVKAQWYLALCYLQKEDLDKVAELLNTVSNKKTTPYSTNAKELLKMLNP